MHAGCQTTFSLHAAVTARFQFSLAKLMVSHDLLCSTVTKQIPFDQRDSNLIPKFERAVDRRCRVLVSKLEPLDTITFT